MAGVQWLLLIHQVPPKPDYVRVKIWRRMQALGAVSLKNAVYILPNSEQAREDFEWAQKEIEAAGGEAMLSLATFIDGRSDHLIETMFRNARARDFEKLADDIAGLAPSEEAAAQLGKLRRRFATLVALDFFPGEAQASVRLLLSKKEAQLCPAIGSAGGHAAHGDYRGRLWVTRENVGIDRLASAWLIRRFVDQDARFAFVAPDDVASHPDAIRFDMAEAAFTHEGDHCTFEVLCSRFKLATPALSVLGEIVHDMDLKDGKFGRDEAPGLAALVEGLRASIMDDLQRIDACVPIFDALFRCFESPEERV